VRFKPGTPGFLTSEFSSQLMPGARILMRVKTYL